MSENNVKPRKPKVSHSPENDNDNPLVQMLLSCIKSIALTAAVGAVLLFVLSYIAYSYYDPDALICIFGYSALYVIAAVCGFSASRFNKGENSLFCGLISGGLMTVIIFLISTALSGEGSLSFPLSLAAHLGVILVSVIFGILGRKRDKPHKKIKIPK